ncbi:phosphatase and actin regulator [Rhodotorula diobovata]|uniref:Phosphatase and actin regulator n=1 Tax=Rhodotorula diobovata TaxID=5288 RepID=A0A5C5FXJ0_9BASI|nr:phosphatase and actin regulator [Rhodotorula diobovata]
MDPMNVAEYADAFPLLEQAMSDLAKGQLVRDERCTMMDLMSAIEINDARTDTFLHAQNERERRPNLPPFDPSLTLSARDVVWLHDEVVRLEATFHSGYPLASTLWTCNCLRADSLAVISGFAPSTSATENDERSKLRTVVLRALFLAVLKSNQIVWEELSKNQVYEHEDVHLSRGSVSFNTLMSACYPPPAPPPPQSPLVVPGQDEPSPPSERLISVDDVLRALDEALRWLQADEQVHAEWLSTEARDALVSRVTLRIDLLYPIALLTFPAHTSPSAISHHLDRIQSYSPLFPSSSTPEPCESSPYDPPVSLKAAFHPSTTVPLLATQQPPRPVDILPLGEAYDLLREVVDDTRELMQLWELWRRGEGGWKDLHEWSRARGRTEAVPYVRSLQQSLISTTTHLFHAHPLSSLAASFLQLLTPLPPSFLSTLPFLLSREYHPTQPAHTLLAFLDRLAAKLAQFAHALAGQNRARQRRWVVKSLGAWGDVVREAEDHAPRLVRDVLAALGPALPSEDPPRVLRATEHLGAAVSAHVHELALEALLSGFEDAVGLLEGGVGRGGASEAWWVAKRLAARLVGLWERLLGTKEAGADGREYLESKRAEARAVEAVCATCWLASRNPTSSTRPPKFSSPFLASLTVPPAQAERGRFVQRFEWLDKLPPPGGDAEGSVSDWATYRDERDQLDKAHLAITERESAEACERAVDALSALARALPAQNGAAPQTRTSQQRLGPLSRVPLSAYALPDQVPFRSLSTELRHLSMENGSRVQLLDSA